MFFPAFSFCRSAVRLRVFCASSGLCERRAAPLCAARPPSEKESGARQVRKRPEKERPTGLKRNGEEKIDKTAMPGSAARVLVAAHECWPHTRTHTAARGPEKSRNECCADKKWIRRAELSPNERRLQTRYVETFDSFCFLFRSRSAAVIFRPSARFHLLFPRSLCLRGKCVRGSRFAHGFYFAVG